MSILNKILQHKEKEVWHRKKEVPYRHLEKSPFFDRTTISLRENLLSDDNAPGIIAEFKRSSPSKGNIHEGACVEEIIPAYEAAGAAGISVLTDNRFFGGSNGDLEKARDLTALPLLRKDFIIDEYQIVEARALGADVILLIAAALEKKTVTTLTRLALELEMEVLFEIYDLLELVKMPDEKILVGINNRDLKTFEVSLRKAIQAVPFIPPELVKVAESGIREPESIRLLQEHGYRGFLIGEAFMRDADPGRACKIFIEKIKRP
jgi:indole-3-glycerol phosphate synthase